MGAQCPHLRIAMTNDQAMKKVMDELLAMTKEELMQRLEEAKDSDIYKSLCELDEFSKSLFEGEKNDNQV